MPSKVAQRRSICAMNHNCPCRRSCPSLIKRATNPIMSADTKAAIATNASTFFIEFLTFRRQDP